MQTTSSARAFVVTDQNQAPTASVTPLDNSRWQSRMDQTRPRRFIVTFRDQEDADGMLRSDFIGLGKTYCGKDSKVLVLLPFTHVSDADLNETLEELRSAGALTYVQEH